MRTTRPKRIRRRSRRGRAKEGDPAVGDDAVETEEFYDLLLLCHTEVHELRVSRNLDAVFLRKVRALCVCTVCWHYVCVRALSLYQPVRGPTAFRLAHRCAAAGAVVVTALRRIVSARRCSWTC